MARYGRITCTDADLYYVAGTVYECFAGVLCPGFFLENQGPFCSPIMLCYVMGGSSRVRLPVVDLYFPLSTARTIPAQHGGRDSVVSRARRAVRVGSLSTLRLQWSQYLALVRMRSIL